MKIVLGADQGGFLLKNKLESYLKGKGHDVTDMGIYEEVSIDYPQIAKVVCDEVLTNLYDFGIIVCGTGIGVSIAANKIKGIRAALIYDVYTAAMAKSHNNANIITLGGRVISEDLAYEMVDKFINTTFEGGRHQKRLDILESFEN